MSGGSDKNAKTAPATKLVGGGRRAEWTGTPDHPHSVVNPPVWRASTHLYPTEMARKDALKSNQDGQFFYGRRGSPTQWALAEALTEIEPGAVGTVLYPSGVAALAGIFLTVLKPGDVLLITDNAYDPTRSMGLGLLKQFGVETRFFDPLDLDNFPTLICDRTRAVLLECPGSLTMEVCDVPALCAIAGKAGLVRIIDNTWASPLGFQALQHGCDIAMQSLTKHVGGHSDVMMGSASAGEAFYPALRKTAQALGHVVSPDDAALALRGLRTMDVRLERETQSALHIADWLQSRDEVAEVRCPMLSGSQGHGIWQRDFTGGCGLFSIILKGGSLANRAAFVDNLELFGIGYSWGGYESLALPFDPKPYRTAMAWPPKGTNPDNRLGVRLSIGLEDPQDLIDDLAAGFAAMENA